MGMSWLFDHNTQRKRQYLPIVGYTVSQSEYDALKAECDRAHELNMELQAEIERLKTEMAELKDRNTFLEFNSDW